MTGKADAKAPPFELFRARDAVPYSEAGPMRPVPPTSIEEEGTSSLHQEGFMDGNHVRLVYSRPGMSLTYVWFKSGFPLPHHSHDADCLYFIISGSVKMGTEELGPGDGFFVGTDVPYSYVPGPEGVELLEFRTSNQFDFKVHANNKAYWTKALADLLAARYHWPEEAAPPSGMEVGLD